MLPAFPNAAPKSTRQSPRARRLERAAELRRLADELDEHSVPTEAQALALRAEAGNAVWLAMGGALLNYGLFFKRDGTRDTGHCSGFCFDEDGARALELACEAVFNTIYRQRVVVGRDARKRSAALRAHAAKLDDAVQRCVKQAVVTASTMDDPA